MPTRATLVMLACLSAGIATQPPQPDTAVVAGIVLAADTGAPIAGALVRVIINGGQARRGVPPTPGQPNPFNQTTRSGPDGRFRFERVPRCASCEPMAPAATQ
jgi:hypothetical protein